MMERVWWSCRKLRVSSYRRALLLLLLLMTLPSCCIHTLTLWWKLRPRNESIDSVSDRTLCRVSTENTSHLQMLAWIRTWRDRSCCWCSTTIIIYLSFRTISACCLLNHKWVAQVLLRFARLFAIGINPCIRWWHDHHRWRRHVILMICCPLLNIFALFQALRGHECLRWWCLDALFLDLQIVISMR